MNYNTCCEILQALFFFHAINSSAEKFASYLGLALGEDSSGDSQTRLRITKAVNTHVRRPLMEAAQSYGRGQARHKSKALKARQQGNTPEVIAYA